MSFVVALCNVAIYTWRRDRIIDQSCCIYKMWPSPCNLLSILNVGFGRMKCCRTIYAKQIEALKILKNICHEFAYIMSSRCRLINPPNTNLTKILKQFCSERTASHNSIKLLLIVRTWKELCYLLWFMIDVLLQPASSDFSMQWVSYMNHTIYEVKCSSQSEQNLGLG